MVQETPAFIANLISNPINKIQKERILGYKFATNAYSSTI